MAAPRRTRARPVAQHDTPPPADPATAYARAVVDGRTPGGPLVRDACRRHLADLSAGAARGLVWNVGAVDRAVSYFRDVLRLNGGEHEGIPFILLPWQSFIVGSLFGWQRQDGTGEDGEPRYVRRFRMAFILTGKGSGKSPLAAGIGLYCLTADGEARAEVYAAASKKDQAQVLFRDAVAMVRMSPALSKRLSFAGGAGREWNIAHLASGSFFRTIASEDGQSGPRPHCALLDEVHEHRDNVVVEMLRAGTKGRRQALLFLITNAEADRTSVCADYRTYSAKVLSGVLADDSFFAYIAGLDDNEDPFADESCWGKANPSLGVTFGVQYLREQVTQARGMPSKEAIVRRLNFCQPTDAVSHWIGVDLWAAAESDFDPEDLAGLPCYLGLDLAQKRDLNALAAAWRHPDGLLSLACWFWTPGETLDERARVDNVPYRAWLQGGHLFAPPGRAVDKGEVATWLEGFAGRHDVRAMAYDQAQADDFLRECDRIGLAAWIDEGDGVAHDGLRMRRHGQGFAGYNSTKSLWMPRSIGAIEDAIMAKRIRIRRNPCLRWNSASAVLLSDPSGNRKWDKRASTGRIDGMVAATMAVGAATDAGEVDAGTSIWDRPELWATAPA